MTADNLAVMKLADGTLIDTGSLPPGQRMCYYCHHLHPDEHVNLLPIGRHHFRMMKLPAGHPQKIECVGCVHHEAPGDHARVRALHAAGPAGADVS